jgi:hypothetical protein
VILVLARRETIDSKKKYKGAQKVLSETSWKKGKGPGTEDKGVKKTKQ